jgi:hypothetical protein
MHDEILLEEGRWKIVKMVEDPECCEIMHNCDVDTIEKTYVTTGQEKCYGCDVEVPEKIATIAALYSKETSYPRTWGKSHMEGMYKNMDQMMKQVFFKMMKESPLSSALLTNIEESDE